MIFNKNEWKSEFKNVGYNKSLLPDLHTYPPAAADLRGILEVSWDTGQILTLMLYEFPLNFVTELSLPSDSRWG